MGTQELSVFSYRAAHLPPRTLSLRTALSAVHSQAALTSANWTVRRADSQAWPQTY